MDREAIVTVGALQVPVREAGPPHGVPVVMLHGFPDCLHSYDRQLEAFVTAGYRTVVPALRGYAETTIVADGDYYLTSLMDDLIDLLDALGVMQAHLIGHDWGAAIGWLAIAKYPERFLSFSSLAIPPPSGLARAVSRHPLQLRNSWYMFFFQLRGIAERVLTRHDFAFIERLWRDWSPGWAWPASTMDRVKQTFRQAGVPRASLGYYRCLFDVLAAQNRHAQALVRRPVQVPVLVLHGRNDGCMDYRLSEAALHPKLFPAGIELTIVDHAGHFLHQEQSERVNSLLLEFVAGVGRST